MNNEPVVWIAWLGCGKRVTGDSIHTCSPQLKELTDEEIFKTAIENGAYQNKKSGHIYPDDMYILNFARAILKKAQEK
jgi:hypothetical protein